MYRILSGYKKKKKKTLIKKKRYLQFDELVDPSLKFNKMGLNIKILSFLIKIFQFENVFVF